MKRIGRYEVQAELGRGGFGQVFLAHDPTVGRAVAIKVLQTSDEPESLMRFRSEAAASGKLRHRNIITIYDFGEQDHVPYLVMEYLEGEDLERLITRRRPLSLLQKLDIMAQAASGLHHAHVHGIVHRDIKPANLMLLADGTVKVMDFGIALLSQANTARITPQGSLIGTFNYMAPEQFYGTVSDPLTDLFAYGVTCYKLLAGTHPFHAPEMAAMMHNIIDKRPQSIRAVVPECPEALEEAVFKMLAKERDARYQSLEDVKFDLEPIIAELQTHHIQELVAQARILIDAGEFDNAQQLVREVLDIDSGNRTARELRERLQRLLKERAVRPQIETLLDAGRLEMGTQHYDEAIKKFESALRLDKSNPEIRALIEKARTDWERYQRADRLVKEARHALDIGDLTAANRGINDALAAFPEHGTAQVLLAAVRQKLEARRREVLLTDGISHGKGLIVLQNFDAAVGFLTRLQSEFPESAELARLLVDATLEREAKLRQDRIAAITGNVKELIREQQFAEASDLATRSMGEFPESKELADLASYATEEERSRKRAEAIAGVTAEASGLAETGEFDAAIKCLKSALDEYPTASSLRELLQSITSAKSEKARQEAFERARANAAELISKGAHAHALDVIAAFTTAYGDSAELDQLRRSAEGELAKQRRIAAIRKFMLQAQGLMDEGRADSASEVLRQATVQFPEDMAVTQLLSVAQDRLREQRRAQEISDAISAAENLARAKQFDAALKLLDESLAGNPAERRLLGCREEITSVKARYEQELATRRISDELTALRRDGQYEAALAILASAPAAFIANDPALSRLKKSIEADVQRKKEIQQTIAQAENLISEGDLVSATRMLKQSASTHPSEPEFSRLLDIVGEHKRKQEREEKIARASDRARTLLAKGEAREASQFLQQAIQDYPGESRLLELLKTAETVTATIRRAEDLRVTRQLEAALGVIDERLRQIPEQPELLTARSRIQAEINAREKDESVARLLANGKSLIAAGRYGEAVSALREACGRFPDVPAIPALLEGAEHEVRQEQQKQEAERALRLADVFLQNGQPEQAIELLETAPKTAPVREMLERAQAALKEKRREESVQEALALCERSHFAEALTILQRAVLQSGSSPEVDGLRERLEKELEQQRKREARDRDLASLLALEREMAAGTGRQRIRRAWRQASPLLNTYAQDTEIGEIGARLKTQVEQSLAPRPVRWKLLAASLTAALLCAITLFILTRSNHDSMQPVPVEIRTDPAGASIRMGDQSCITPTCRFDIKPGQYTLDASLHGYQSLTRSVTVYTGKERHYMDFVLEPLPPPPPATPASGLGTLTVKTGQPSVLIFVDNIAQRRSDNSGSVTLELPAGTHDVRVAKAGFQASGDQKIAISSHGSGTLSFNLVPVPSAPEEQHASTQNLTPAPPAARSQLPAAGPPVVSAEAAEAEEWRRTQSSGDAAVLRSFLSKYPASSHAADAQARIDDLDWSRINTSDAQSLGGYLGQYPNGRHAHEASLKIAELDWMNLDKGNEDAIRAYLAAHPNSTFRSQADALIAEMESRKSAAEHARNEPLPARDRANVPSQGESFGIDSALAQFNQAFQKKQPRDVKRIWPTVPAEYTEAMRLSGATFVMNLHPMEAAEINGDAASIRCDLLTIRTVRGKSDQTHKSVRVRLQRVDGAWSILDPLGS